MAVGRRKMAEKQRGRRKVKERVAQCHCEFVTIRFPSSLSSPRPDVFCATRLLPEPGRKPLGACRVHTYLPFFNPCWWRAASLLLAPRALALEHRKFRIATCLAGERETVKTWKFSSLSFRADFRFRRSWKSFNRCFLNDIFFFSFLRGLILR